MEIYAEEFEAGLGLGMENTFGVLANPTVWVPGSCELKPTIDQREVEWAIGEWDETHLQDGPRTDDGTLSIQVCPGRDTLIFGAGGILTRRDTRHLRSFSVAEVIGEQTIYHRGVVVDSWELKCAKDEDLVIDLDCKGVWGAPGAGAIPDYTSLPAAYILADLDLTILGQQRIEFDTLSLKGEHDLRDDIYGNALYRQDITTQSRKLAVNLEGYRDAAEDALYVAWRDQTAVSLVARWSRGANSRTATIATARVMEYEADTTRQTAELKVLTTAGSSTDGVVWS